MRAIRYAQHGDPATVAGVVEIDAPQPAAGEILMRVEATPVRAADIYCMRGLPGFRHPLPAIPGETGIGRVTEVGPRVTDWALGDRVFLPRTGTWREYLVAPGDELFRAPSEGAAVELAQVNSNAITADALLRYAGQLQAGDWLIQSAATSNVGRYVIQLAARRGIRTVNMVRRPDVAEELHALGADVVVVDSDGVESLVADATRGARIGLGFDMVGGVTTCRMAACLCEGGVIAVYGQIGGTPAQVPLSLMLFRNLTIRGFLTEPELRRQGLTRAAIAQRYAELSDAIVAGRLRSKIAAVYPFGRIHAAIAHFLTGASGKILLVPDADQPAPAIGSRPFET
jgi:NADPH:quinone reductase-like Zn-dependent oxidoreductase